MILVTGASGRIGNVLVRELVSRGNKVRAIVRDVKDAALLDAAGKVDIFKGDITDSAAVDKACKGVSLVYHLAAVISVMSKNKDLMFNVNVKGTENIIDACLKHKSKLVYMSSIHAIREPKERVITEECGFDAEHAISYYDRTKAIASLMVIEAVKNKGLKAVIVSPTGVLGPFDYSNSFIGQYFRDYISGKQLFCISGAYDFVDVRDVVQGTIAAAKKGRPGENYLLSGNKITVVEINSALNKFKTKKSVCLTIPFPIAYASAVLWEMICKIAGRNTFFTPYSLITLRRNSNISHKKAGEELGYRPRSAVKALEDQVEWMKKEKII